jgi:type I restriction enzyme S subunit
LTYEILEKIIEKPISGEWGDEGSGIKVLRSTNFTNEGVLDLSDVVERNVAFSKIEKKKLKKGDIIIEKSGGSPNQPVGRVVFFEHDGDYLFSNFTSALRPKVQKVYPKYLHYFLFATYKMGVTNLFQNKTTGIINLQLNRYIQKLQIPLPSLSTQRRIAEVLDKADRIRRRNRENLKKYDQLAQSVFLEMFGDPFINDKNWKIKLVEDVAEPEKYAIKAGPFGSSLKKEFYVESGYKIYGQEQVIKDDLSFGDYYIDEEKYQELKNCKIKQGDILISLVGTYGKISIVPNKFEPGIINPRLMKISPDKDKVNPLFFKFLLTSKGVRVQIENMSRGGTMDIVNVGIMKKIKIPIPPVDLQNKFEVVIDKIEGQKRIVGQELKKAEALFQSILQRAFKGELFEDKEALQEA